MSNLGNFFIDVNCKDRSICTSSNYCCRTCLRNKANKYEDKFSLEKEGYKSKEWTLK